MKKLKNRNIDINLIKNQKSRVNIFRILIIVVYLLISTRLFYMQVLNSDSYREKAQKNRIRIRRIDAPRGKIYDRNGELIAKNKAGYRLVYLNGRSYDDEILETISELLKIDKTYIVQRIKNGEIYRYTGENVLIDDLEVSKAHQIMEKLSDYPYLDVISYPKRNYVYDKVASHLLGYVKPITKEEFEKLKDNPIYTKRSLVGKKGIEKQYDELLQGQDGYEYIEVNAYNKIVKKIKNGKVVPGKDLYLTIDMKLQRHITDYLKDEKASFLAMDAKTGEIITMVSSPEYSLNTFVSKIGSKTWNEILNDPKKPLINRFMGSSFPPGSIYKPIVALSFLENGINPKKEIYDPGYYSIGKWKYKSWKDGGHGYVDMEKSIIESVNTYYYQFADSLGHRPIIEISSKMGLGEKTGIDIPGEKTGVLPSHEWKKKITGESWYRGDTVNLSIGQGYLLVTPLQMLLAYDVFANKGIGYKPHLLKKIDQKSNGEVAVKPEIKIEYKSNPDYYDLLDTAMQKVVSASNGTAKRIRMKNVKIAAKTGSAQNAHYADTHAWAAGYFPADNPEIIFISFVEGGGSGGAVAVKAVKEFMKKYYELY